MMLITKYDLNTDVAFIPFDGDATKYKRVLGKIVGISAGVNNHSKPSVTYTIVCTKNRTWDIEEEGIIAHCTCVKGHPDYCEVHAA